METADFVSSEVFAPEDSATGASKAKAIKASRPLPDFCPTTNSTSALLSPRRSLSGDGMKPMHEFKRAALRFQRLAEEATTASVRAHLFRLARHYEALIALPDSVHERPGVLPARRGDADGTRGGLQR
jgi:hypothetical protein